jgi:acyl-CoA reductase-like NAD-dependent aldehyde dehydrogenase
MKSQLLIDNQWVNAENDAQFKRLHPLNNSVVTEAASASVADAKKSADSAHVAFKTWRQSASDAVCCSKRLIFWKE